MTPHPYPTAGSCRGMSSPRALHSHGRQWWAHNFARSLVADRLRVTPVKTPIACTPEAVETDAAALVVQVPEEATAMLDDVVTFARPA